MRRLGLLLLALAGTVDRPSAQIVDAPLPRVDWAQKLGAQVPLDARFTNADGEAVVLGDLLDDKPVVLALVYYECPMLCNLVVSGMVSSFRGMNIDAGDDFDLVVLSIDPGESHELAREQRDGWYADYGRGDVDGWHFLVGDETNIATVADAVGFDYSYVPETDEYAHAAGICVVTPSGELSRIFYGTEYAPRDLKFGLMEASEGTIGTPIEKVVLRCFAYDPARGEYGLAIMTSLRVAGVGTVLLLGFFVFTMVRRDRRRALQAA